MVLLPYEPCLACCFRDIDKVDDLMQDITEQQELAQEISDAISKPVGFGEEFDEVGNTFQIFDLLHLWGFSVVFSKCDVWFWTDSCFKMDGYISAIAWFI